MIDYDALLSNKQAITTSAYSTYVYNLGSDDAMVPMANQKPSELFIQITTAFAGGTSLYVTLQTSDDESFTAGAYTTVLSTECLETSQLVAGRQFRADNLPRGMQQYIRFYYVVVGTFTQGNISAGLIIDKQYMPSQLQIDYPLRLITEAGARITTEDGRTIVIGEL